jgi:hypothetical protein
MDLAVTGVAAGVLGTLAMDCLNYLFSRTGMLLKIDVAMIGRMSAGWARGRFFYRHPGEMEPFAHEVLYGYISHYAIGVGFALAFMFGWDLLVGGPASPLWALVYGIATSAGSNFFIFPSMGLGVFGRRSPEGLRAPLSTLANHLFYGVGMAAAIALA